ncbi:toxin-antitoxin system HicB family antitoxin [Mycobacterium sp. CBMA271]|uniref:toxin-antitoxin system HicB family antitoxin n=1 Tax=unclassified Mycobacteroides TaxID=2618759 RepID=UPI0012DE50D3|nr:MULTISPECIES: toxin-antitoxin system HicB family antitoxin [unclassified Mycobacteroides]MUM19972.1 histidine kinase [Mycobacteroides sp. CBMA 326]MUM20146.1 toxin-antitoxin system HicB family antitoxin [Mycobacteroides sp. CBMA 271]
MDLQPYVDSVRQDLAIAAKAGGSEAEQLGDRLTAPLDSAIRLALLDALSTAAEEITRELAPTSVDVRLRGREPEFVVTRPIEQTPSQPPVVSDDGGGTWRVTLRLPENLRAIVEAAAAHDGISLNGWLVRAATVAAGKSTTSATSHRGNTISGWVR